MLTVQTLNRLISNVPEYKAFNTVNEMDANSFALAEKYPDLVSISVIGHTRAGHPLQCLKIGSGSKNALLLGLPHPNEPIGAMLLEYFTQALVQDEALRKELDYTWYIVKAWDADGARLNEGWYKGPFNLYNYARNFYRPPSDLQVEWTFPVDYKAWSWQTPIPETKAVMDLMDKTCPILNYSLHNSGFGGVYFYITEPTEAIYDAIRGVAGKNGIPLNLGEPEGPYMTAVSPAVFNMPMLYQSYDYYEKYGIEHPEKLMVAGTCSAEYARNRCNTFTFLTELPYFYDPRVADLSATTTPRKDAILEKLDHNKVSNEKLRALIAQGESYFSEDNPFHIAVSRNLQREGGDEATRAMVTTDPEYELPATAAELFDNQLTSRFYKMLAFGMTVRMFEFELARLRAAANPDQAKIDALTAGMAEADVEVRSTADYLEEKMHYQVVPIQTLIRIQLESGMIMADHLANRS